MYTYIDLCIQIYIHINIQIHSRTHTVTLKLAFTLTHTHISVHVCVCVCKSRFLSALSPFVHPFLHSTLISFSLPHPSLSPSTSLSTLLSHSLPQFPSRSPPPLRRGPIWLQGRILARISRLQERPSENMQWRETAIAVFADFMTSATLTLS